MGRNNMFEINQKYTRKQIRNKLGHKDHNSITGIWATGYIRENENYFIFVTLSGPGRTGHDYANNLIGNILYWHMKRNHKISSKTGQELLNINYKKFIFIRKDNKDSFTFFGYGIPIDHGDGDDNWIVWKIIQDIDDVNKNSIIKQMKFTEGKKSKISVSIYERNAKARKVCLDHYGYNCTVCDFNFEKKYGDIGKNYIHVHHLIELSSLSQEYKVDPVKDLRPVCANCHAMLHQRRPAYSIEEMRKILTHGSSKF